MKCTLLEWQKNVKPVHDFILQPSSIEIWDGWQPFPIGMSYRWVDFQEKWDAIQIGNHEQLILVAVSEGSDHRRRPRAPNRKSFVFSLYYKGFRNVTMTNEQYFMRLKNYKFVVSPEGNGIDCHRTYEALMAGCIPIVEDRPEIREKYKGCPILYTNDYKELNTLYLLRKYDEMKSQIWDFSRLFYSSYTNEEKKEIRRASLYWMKKTRPNFPPFYKEDGQEKTPLDADSNL